MSRLAGVLMLGLVLAGCGPRHGQAPDWVLSAPRGTAAAVSCTAAWALDPAHFQPALHDTPLASQSLAMFLERTRMDPRQPTGRVTLYQVPAVPEPAAADGGDPARPADAREFLLQLGGFQHPGQMLVALADGFPPRARCPWITGTCRCSRSWTGTPGISGPWPMAKAGSGWAICPR